LTDEKEEGRACCLQIADSKPFELLKQFLIEIEVFHHLDLQSQHMLLRRRMLLIGTTVAMVSCC